MDINYLLNYVSQIIITSPQEVNQVGAITLNPTMNLRDSQRTDPHLAYIIDMKTRILPKPNLKQIQDPAPKTTTNISYMMTSYTDLLVKVTICIHNMSY